MFTFELDFFEIVRRFADRFPYININTNTKTKLKNKGGKAK